MDLRDMNQESKWRFVEALLIELRPIAYMTDQITGAHKHSVVGKIDEVLDMLEDPHCNQYIA